MDPDEGQYWMTGIGWMTFILIGSSFAIDGWWPAAVMYSGVGGMLFLSHIKSMVELS